MSVGNKSAIKRHIMLIEERKSMSRSIVPTNILFFLITIHIVKCLGPLPLANKIKLPPEPPPPDYYLKIRALLYNMQSCSTEVHLTLNHYEEYSIFHFFIL